MPMPKRSRPLSPPTPSTAGLSATAVTSPIVLPVTALPSPTGLTSLAAPPFSTALALSMALSTLPRLPAAAIGEPFHDRREAAPAPVAGRKNLVFVIMSLRRGGRTVYAAIQDECRKLKLDARRSDDDVGSNLVIQEIAYLIHQAEFIICDLTHERPNVYYELGYAHGVGNNGTNIILIAKAGTRLHFDVVPLRVHYYSSTRTLRNLLARNLKPMLEARRPPTPAS